MIDCLIEPVRIWGEPLTIIGISGIAAGIIGVVVFILFMAFNFNAVRKEEVNKNSIGYKIVYITFFFIPIGLALIGIDVIVVKQFTFRTGRTVYGLPAIIMGAFLSFFGLMYLFILVKNAIKERKQIGHNNPSQ